MPSGPPLPARATGPRRSTRPDVADQSKTLGEQVLLAFFIVVPLLALLAAVPLAWGWGLGWHDLVIGAVMYLITGFGVTVGYHRLFTHGSFRTGRPLRIILAVAGSLAIEMGVTDWVAAHRRHHKYSDQAADPHSPWRFGHHGRGLAKGFLHAHVGWLFHPERTAPETFCPDLLADRDIAAISARFPWLVAASVLLPPLVGGLWSMSWAGAATALFWGALVRIALLHHVTFSINSICHTIGTRPFAARDRSSNVWWLAIPSLGESWHNLHHADPTSARHGVLPGQIDPSAALIRLFEKLGWAHDVRWPTAKRIAARRVDAGAGR
ncbi:acyl-CoA desaturase [Frankia sp. B2]|nr:stearoyl-CoA 9-desaturase [Frankia sp. CgIS1]TFE31986.1 acyl-CoA desaturase [Frankia sp. B2]